MKIVMISDTHGEHRKLNVPDGDILIHAGDAMTNGNNYRELVDLDNWFASLPHKHKYLIAGNHDFLFERLPETRKLIQNATYLQDEAVVVNGLKIYGSPWQPEFFNWAFNLPRGEALAAKWAMIPDDTDILITHGPPAGYQDWVGRQRVGCQDLLERVNKVKPLIHVFGHIHCAAGYTEHVWDDGNDITGQTVFVNAAVVDEAYRVRYEPTVITLKKEPRNKE